MYLFCLIHCSCGGKYRSIRERNLDCQISGWRLKLVQFVWFCRTGCFPLVSKAKTDSDLYCFLPERFPSRWIPCGVRHQSTWMISAQRQYRPLKNQCIQAGIKSRSAAIVYIMDVLKCHLSPGQLSQETMLIAITLSNHTAGSGVPLCKRYKLGTAQDLPFQLYV